MRTPAPIRVLLVSGCRAFREELREVLEPAGIEVVGESAAADHVPVLVHATAPQVIVLDERLPDRDAHAVSSQLHRTGTPTPCIILTEAGAGSDAPAEPGGPLILPRRTAPHDLADAVRDAAARGTTQDNGPPGEPVAAEPLRQAILAMLGRLRAAGSQDRAVLAEAWEPAVLRHSPTTDRTGCPCAACGEPWPCSMLLDIVQGMA